MKPKIEPNFIRIPSDLRYIPRWHLWKLEMRPGAKAPTKVPYRSDRRGHAKTDDPTTWSSFVDAYNGFESDVDVAGVGFVLGDVGDGRTISGLDIDKCIDTKTGRIAPWALEFINKASTYTEVSPSGTGVKLLMWGVKPPDTRCQMVVDSETGRPRKGGGSKFELYDYRRFFTITGAVVNDLGEIKDGGEFLEWVCEKLGLREEVPDPAARSVGEGGSGIEDDELLLARARGGKRGRRFVELFDTEKYAGPGNSEARGELLMELAFWTGRRPEQMKRLFARSFMDQCAARGTREGKAFIDYEIDRAIRKSNDVYTGRLARGASPEPKKRPKITIGCELADTVSEACDALAKVDPPAVFSRGGRVVEVVEADAMGPLEIGTAGFTRIAEIGRHRMRVCLAEHIIWLKPPDKDGYECQVKPPLDVADAILDQARWPFKRLTALSQCPILRPDGSVCCEPGYDNVSGGYFDATGLDGRENWVTDDINWAMKTLCYPISQFPWVSDTDRSAALAMLLTMVARPAIRGSVPAFLVNSTTPGTGKTLLARWAMSVFMRGEPCKGTQADSDSETRKMMVAALLEGNPVMFIDNLSGSFGSPTMDAFITGVSGGRELGKSKMVIGDWRAVIVMTGNNVMVKGDLGRRVIPINIDAGMERPELRQGFEIVDLLSWTRENRGELLRAALSIPVGYCKAGRPNAATPGGLGSFEEWSDLVRGALMWAGMPDPAAGQERMMESQDEEMEVAAEMVSALVSEFGDVAFTIREVMQRGTDSMTGGAEVTTLGMALDGACGGRKVTSRGLARFLSRYKGRVINGVQICDLGKSNGVRAWRIDKMSHQIDKMSQP
jgi:hypothetical protein